MTLVGSSNVGSPPENTTVHQRNHVNENKTTSTYSSAVRNKSKNISFFSDSILMTLRMAELAIHIGINDFLKGTANVSVNSICNGILKIAFLCQNQNIAKMFIPSVAYSTKVSSN